MAICRCCFRSSASELLICAAAPARRKLSELMLEAVKNGGRLEQQQAAGGAGGSTEVRSMQGMQLCGGQLTRSQPGPLGLRHHLVTGHSLTQAS